MVRFLLALCLESRKKKITAYRGWKSKGVLSCLDGYMNIALEQTEEHVNGTVTNRYGDAFIRGNNGPSFAPLALFARVIAS